MAEPMIGTATLPLVVRVESPNGEQLIEAGSVEVRLPIASIELVELVDGETVAAVLKLG